MRQAADILASPAAMSIRTLDALQNMAKTANSKVVFGASTFPCSRCAAPSLCVPDLLLVLPSSLAVPFNPGNMGVGNPGQGAPAFGVDNFKQIAEQSGEGGDLPAEAGPSNPLGQAAYYNNVGSI